MPAPPAQVSTGKASGIETEDAAINQYYKALRVSLCRY